MSPAAAITGSAAAAATSTGGLAVIWTEAPGWPAVDPTIGAGAAVIWKDSGVLNANEESDAYQVASLSALKKPLLNGSAGRLSTPTLKPIGRSSVSSCGAVLVKMMA